MACERCVLGGQPGDPAAMGGDDAEVGAVSGAGFEDEPAGVRRVRRVAAQVDGHDVVAALQHDGAGCGWQDLRIVGSESSA